MPRRRRNALVSGHPALVGLITAALALASADRVRTTGTPGPALQVGRSVNMVAGTTWPTGDPFLQRQNEPSIAASTRNPLHLLGGSNDYRTVDLPGLPDSGETGDAWLGLFKSFDGGERWQSNLIPGYPQDTTPDGMASPLKAYQAGADPVVRPGTNGLFYYSGLAFNRGADAPSAVFVARYIDNNNKENGDPIAYIGTSIVDTSSGASFLDKPWVAVDVPRGAARPCTISSSAGPAGAHGNGRPHWRQSILAGTIYVSYSRITTVGTSVESRILFSHSDDCGATWSQPVQLSDPNDQVNQGSTIAIDPRTGAVYVSWRQFAVGPNEPDSVMVARSVTAGRAFGKPAKVHTFFAGRHEGELFRMLARGHRMGDPDEISEIAPFDEPTEADRFRTNAYPTLAIDDESRVYAAWTERGFGVVRPSPSEGDARIVLSTSHDGQTWTPPQAIDTGAPGVDKPGHQLMPSIAYAAGHLLVVYYDLREDVSEEFGPFVSETDAAAVAPHLRHTVDIRATQATKGDNPVFGPSVQVSEYLMGSAPGSTKVEQLQFNPPNLPLFEQGEVPFMGDYIDLSPAPAFVEDGHGQWSFNTSPSSAPVFHAVWTDNRDVRPPADGDWTHYTPVGSTGGTSTFDPTKSTPACVPGQTGMRNQNIYTARLTFGLVAGSPGNTKPLDPKLPRAFVVYAQNTTTDIKSFRMTITKQPTGGAASFVEKASQGQTFPLTSVDVTTPPLSLAARTVFVTSTDPKAQVTVSIQELAGGAPVSGGLSSAVILNPDISNPDISNPDISNPDISNPDISNAEVLNPDISNPDISNPDISNPDISNPDISNPDISNVVVANPDISNPDISNPDISNPDISNPDISNPDISNTDLSDGSVNDVTWTVTNTGNTTGAFNLTLFLNNAAATTGGIKTQLILHKNYLTPVAAGCTLKTQTTSVLIDNVINPTFEAPGSTPDSSPSNPALTTLWLAPGESAKITLRVVDPNPGDGITLNPVTDVTPFVQAQALNTPDLTNPNATPPSTEPPATPPTTLAFGVQPAAGVAGQLLGPIQVRVSLNARPEAGVPVTLAIAVNPSGGHLIGNVTAVSNSDGNAEFGGLAIDKAGTGYVLSASSPAAVPVLSRPIDIGLPITLRQPRIDLAGNMLGETETLVDFEAGSPAGTYTVNFFTCGQGPLQPIGSPTTVPVAGATARIVGHVGTLVAPGQFVAIQLGTGTGVSPFSPCFQVGSYDVGSPQPVGYYNGHYYSYVTYASFPPTAQFSRTWSSAKLAASSSQFAGYQGHLVTIFDAGENTFVQSLRAKMNLGDMRAWIGLYDFNGQNPGFDWVWVTGQVSTGYFNWNTNEPNNDTTEFYVEFFKDGTWNNNVDGGDPDFPPQGYVVEYDGDLPLQPVPQ